MRYFQHSSKLKPHPQALTQTPKCYVHLITKALDMETWLEEHEESYGLGLGLGALVTGCSEPECYSVIMIWAWMLCNRQGSIRPRA